MVVVVAWFPRFSAAPPSVRGGNAEVAPTVGNGMAPRGKFVRREISLGFRDAVFNTTWDSVYRGERT